MQSSILVPPARGTSLIGGNSPPQSRPAALDSDDEGMPEMPSCPNCGKIARIVSPVWHGAICLDDNCGQAFIAPRQ